ncbi:MAG: hypothetical protein ACR2I2_18420 [Bryobacteraceae bacterium]
MIDAQDWYEGEAPGLERRALLRRFPYTLFFTIEGNTLLVIACFHASRDPRQWQQRT